MITDIRRLQALIEEEEEEEELIEEAQEVGARDSLANCRFG
jgi:hypothetical protein